MGNEHAHHRTVDRVAQLLDAVVARPEGATLTVLARALGAPVSSVQKLVDGLVAVGYLDETERRYRLGPAPSVLAIRAGRPSVRVRHADLATLSARVGLPTQLAVRVGDDGVWVDRAGADEALDYALSSRARHPLTESAAGRVLLAHLPPAVRRTVVTRARSGDPAETVALLDAADRIRGAGHETGESGRLLPGALAVAVPVWDEGRAGVEVVAAVSVVDRGAGLAGRLGEVLATLRQVADAPGA